MVIQNCETCLTKWPDVKGTCFRIKKELLCWPEKHFRIMHSKWHVDMLGVKKQLATIPPVKKKKKSQVRLFLEIKVKDHGLCFQSWKIPQVFKVRQKWLRDFYQFYSTRTNTETSSNSKTAVSLKNLKKSPKAHRIYLPDNIWKTTHIKVYTSFICGHVFS